MTDESQTSSGPGKRKPLSRSHMINLSAHLMWNVLRFFFFFSDSPPAGGALTEAAGCSILPDSSTLCPTVVTAHQSPDCPQTSAAVTSTSASVNADPLKPPSPCSSSSSPCGTTSPPSTSAQTLTKRKGPAHKIRRSMRQRGHQGAEERREDEEDKGREERMEDDDDENEESMEQDATGEMSGHRQ